MKKFLALVLTVVMAASLAACGNSGTKETQAPASGDSETAAESTAAESTGETAEKVGEGVDVKDLKVGFIFIGDENEGYTAAHYAGAKGMQEALGLSDDQIIIKWNIPEDETCYDAAVDLADQGCNIVFANSFGHESYILQAAAEFPDEQFYGSFPFVCFLYHDKYSCKCTFIIWFTYNELYHTVGGNHTGKYRFSLADGARAAFTC